MGRKRNPVLPVFTRDILSSPRCRALSEQAAGVYFFLLCRLNEPPQPGAYRISDWELHPNWRRSKTQQCLATADKYERLPYFAAMLAKNDLPWRQKNILAGLQELYKYGIIVVESDMLVQPRMYKDNGFTLPDLDRDGDPEGTIADDQASGSMAVVEGSELRGKKGVQKQVQKSAEISTEKGTEKVHEKAPVSHAGASRKEIEIEPIYNNKGNIGGVGEGDAQFEAFWFNYDKRNCNRADCYEAWRGLTAEERTAAVGFVDEYKRRVGVAKYRKSPANYLTEKIWLQDIPETPDPDRSRRETGAKVVQNPVQKPQNSNGKGEKTSSTKTNKAPVAAAPPSLDDIQAYCDERREQQKPFLYITAEEFLDICTVSNWTRGKKNEPIYDWKAYLRQCDLYRQRHGDVPVGQRAVKPGAAVPLTSAAPDKYKDKW